VTFGETHNGQRTHRTFGGAPQDSRQTQHSAPIFSLVTCYDDAFTRHPSSVHASTRPSFRATVSSYAAAAAACPNFSYRFTQLRQHTPSNVTVRFISWSCAEPSNMGPVASQFFVSVARILWVPASQANGVTATPTSVVQVAHLTHTRTHTLLLHDSAWLVHTRVYYPNQSVFRSGN
jgi:hypothetical protein